MKEEKLELEETLQPLADEKKAARTEELKRLEEKIVKHATEKGVDAELKRLYVEKRQLEEKIRLKSD